MIMMLESIIGLALLTFFFLLFAHILQDKHQALKVGALFFAVFFMFLTSKAVLDNDQHCSIEINQTSISGNITSYTYARQCFDAGNNTADTAFKTMTWWFRSVYLYLIGFTIYLAFMYLVNLQKNG